MSGSVNKVTLIGNCTRDPEVRHMNSGDSVVSFGLATSESWKSKDTGERKEKTEFHNIVIWNDGLGKVAEQYLKKGSKVYIEGQLQTREYTDKDGAQRKTTEIVLQKFRGALTLLDGRSSEDGERSQRSSRDDDQRPAERERSREDDRRPTERERPRDDDYRERNPPTRSGGGRPAFNDDVPFFMEWR